MTNLESQRRKTKESTECQLVMPCWYFEKEDLRNTPSIQDGLDYQTELRYRNECSKFIINSGTKLKLRCETFATGVVFFHRFYMFHSFKSFPRYVTSACCLLLAGKIEETPKKCRDIVRVARSLLSDHHFNQFGQDPREEVMSLERVLLKTIKFDLQADHPYRHLLNYGKKIRGDKEKIQPMVQMAWTFTNDSLCTTLCLQWEPEIIACALLYLATKLKKFEIEDWENKERSSKKWWEHFVPGLSLDVMEDICHQILDLYSKPDGGGVELPAPTTSVPSTSASTETSSRRKRKADSNVSESIGVQAGSGRSARSSKGSAIPSTVPPTSSMGYQMQQAQHQHQHHQQPLTASGNLSYGSYTESQGMAALAAATANMPADYQAGQLYAVYARQQQAAAAAAAAVYGGSGPPHGSSHPPSHSSSHGPPHGSAHGAPSYGSSHGPHGSAHGSSSGYGQNYGHGPPPGSYSNANPASVRMSGQSKMGNQSGQGSSSYTNPSVRISRR